MKKLSRWFKKSKKEVKRLLVPPVIDEKMLTKDNYVLPNEEVIDVRFATANDLEDIMDIQKSCYDGQAPWGRIAVINELKNKVNSFFIICHYYNQPLAFISMSYRRKSIHVTNIATIPAYQKQGIATFLIEKAAEIGLELGCNYMTLEVRISNEPAKSLYRKIGFTDGSVKKNYYHDNREDALNMIYKLEKVDDPEDVQPIK